MRLQMLGCFAFCLFYISAGTVDFDPVDLTLFCRILNNSSAPGFLSSPFCFSTFNISEFACTQKLFVCSLASCTPCPPPYLVPEKKCQAVEDHVLL